MTPKRGRLRIASELWQRIQPYKSALSLVVVLSMVYTATDLLYPLVYRQVVNDIAGLFVKQVYDEAVEENTVLNDIIDELVGLEESDSTAAAEMQSPADSIASESPVTQQLATAPQVQQADSIAKANARERQRLLLRSKRIKHRFRHAKSNSDSLSHKARTALDSTALVATAKPKSDTLAPTTEKHSSTHVARRTPDQVVQTMVWAVFILFVLGMVGYALWLVGETISERVATQVEKNFLLDTFRHVLRLPLSFFSNRSSGVLTKQIDEADHVSPIITDVSKHILPNVVRVLGTFAVMLALNSQLTLIVLATIPPYIWLARYSAKRLETGLSVYYELWENISSRLQNAIYAVKTVKLAGAEHREVEALEQISDEAYTEYMQRNKVTTRFVFWDAFITHFGSAVVLVVGGTLALKRQLTPGDVVMFVVYVEELYSPIDSLATIWIQMQQNIASFHRTFRLLQSGEEERSGNELVVSEGLIEFRDVRFAYSPKRQILKGLTLSARPGEITAIVGSSGAGKTTSMDLLLKLYEPQSGSILIDGQNIRDVDPASLRSHVGLVAADGTVFRASLRDNISYNRPSASEEEILEAIRDAGLESLLARLPGGLDEEIGEAGIGLSVGERQRVQLARILVAEPAILILDEATANLDYATEREIRTTIDRFRVDKTVIIIAHRFSMVRDANQVYVLQDGRAVESGSPQELIEQGGWFAKFAASAKS